MLHANYFKAAGDLGRNEANKEILDGKYKGTRAKEHIVDIVKFLHHGKGIPHENIWSVTFGAPAGRVYRIAESEI